MKIKNWILSLIFNKQLKVGIIGFGSIGKRHAVNLLNLGIKDIVLLRKQSKGNEFGIREVYVDDDLFSENLDFILLANPTSKHFEYLQIIMMQGLSVLCEKPIVSNLCDLEKVKEIINGYNKISGTALNMRYHPCYLKVKQLITENKFGKVLSARLFVGQYLPDWRPDTDYRNSYSANRKMGGGVTLDLVHEIDLALDLFSRPSGDLLSIAGKFSDLSIETEDITEILYRTESNSLVSIHLDYVYRGYKRIIEINCDKGNIYADFFTNEIRIFGVHNTLIWEESFPKFSRNDMYVDLLKKYLSCINSGSDFKPSLRDGLNSTEIAVKILKQNGLINI